MTVAKVDTSCNLSILGLSTLRSLDHSAPELRWKKTGLVYSWKFNESKVQQNGDTALWSSVPMTDG